MTQRQERRHAAQLMQRFIWCAIDAGNCEIDGLHDVYANDLGHALQKIAAALPIDQSEINRIEIRRGITLHGAMK